MVVEAGRAGRLQSKATVGLRVGKIVGRYKVGKHFQLEIGDTHFSYQRDLDRLAEELRRRRSALGWTLEQVAAQAQVSVGMLSLIETGKRRPSRRSWERIRGALGI
jgi:DNA-binding XRE family transcriptional regulator